MDVCKQPGFVASLLAAALLAAAMACNAAAPLEAYGRLATLEDVVLSPDGQKLAFVHTAADARILAVMSLADRKVLGGAQLGETKLRSIHWADNDHLLIYTSATGMPMGLIGEDREWSLLTVYTVSKRKLTPYPQNIDSLRIMAHVVSGRVMVRHLGNDTILYIPGYYLDQKTLPALFKVNLTTGFETAARQGSDYTRDWIVDDAGDIVAETDYRERDQQWQLRIRQNGRLVEALSRHAPIDTPAVLGFGPKGDSLLISEVEDGTAVWRLLSLADATLGPPMAEQKNLAEPIEDPRSHRMIGGARLEDSVKYVFFDKELQSRWSSVVNAFDGERVRLTSASADLMQFVVRVDGPAHGFQYQLVDMNTAHAIAVGKVYDDINESFETKRINYAAADGFRIPAYLTLPTGRPPTKLPLIVLPHGGPASRDTVDFDWWAQAMASRGYAVLRPQFRGSALGRKFVEAGFGEWGRKMQTDLSDGVRYLDKEGIIDPQRVCIVGGSYGGYAALAGVTLDPGVYRCAVSVAGISDLRRFLEWVNSRDHAGAHISQRYWDRFMGVENYRDLNLDAISPVKHIDAINVPVLLIHGRDDTVVPFDQSDVMLSAMKKAGKKVELVTLKKEDHWLSRSETRLQMLKALVAFVEANNPPN
jgi:dipeptidyl aminopeptidase/acylaminoacyl peptidase